MYVEKAENLYHGEESYNCAQAVLKAFQNVYDVPEEMIVEYKKNGGGRTEDNSCGAVYAALNLVEEEDREMVKTKFLEKSKYLYCKQIRGEKTLTCKGCVATAAGILQDLNV